jgi:LPXTG-motif cell wall-anchored protein
MVAFLSKFIRFIYQQVQKMLEVNKDAFGMAKLEYDLKSEKGGMPFMLIGGSILTLAGAGLFVIKRKKA